MVGFVSVLIRCSCYVMRIGEQSHSILDSITNAWAWEWSPNVAWVTLTSQDPLIKWYNVRMSRGPAQVLGSQRLLLVGHLKKKKWMFSISTISDIKILSYLFFLIMNFNFESYLSSVWLQSCQFSTNVPKQDSFWVRVPRWIWWITKMDETCRIWAYNPVCLPF